jgi:hypothetical protein
MTAKPVDTILIAKGWAASHPCVVLGLASLAIVAVAGAFDIAVDSPAGAIIRVVIAPMYFGRWLALTITKFVVGGSVLSDRATYLMHLLMIPLSIAPYLLLDAVVGLARRWRVALRVS